MKVSVNTVWLVGWVLLSGYLIITIHKNKVAGIVLKLSITTFCIFKLDYYIFFFIYEIFYIICKYIEMC